MLLGRGQKVVDKHLKASSKFPLFTQSSSLVCESHTFLWSPGRKAECLMRKSKPPEPLGSLKMSPCAKQRWCSCVALDGLQSCFFTSILRSFFCLRICSSPLHSGTWVCFFSLRPSWARAALPYLSRLFPHNFTLLCTSDRFTCSFWPRRISASPSFGILSLPSSASPCLPSLSSTQTCLGEYDVCRPFRSAALRGVCVRVN